MVTQVLVACFCAIPVNSDTLEMQAHLETPPGPSGGGWYLLPVSSLGRPLACVTRVVLHPGYRVGLLANYGRRFHSVQMVFCDLSSVVP